MHKLLTGIQRFQRRIFPSWRRRFESLAEGQQPSALFITCSDSRIIPHLVTQSEPGEMFVLRNAGNLVPPHDAPYSGEAATIEYAVQVLNVAQIIVCGHSHCGAVQAVLNPNSTDRLPAVREWLKYAAPARASADQTECEFADDPLTHAVKANVAMQLAHLRTYPGISSACLDGTLTLHGWFYRFETGEVAALDDRTDEFAPLIAQGRINSDLAHSTMLG